MLIMVWNLVTIDSSILLSLHTCDVSNVGFINSVDKSVMEEEKEEVSGLTIKNILCEIFKYL